MQRSVDRIWTVAALLALWAGPAAAQYREYYVRGKVQGTAGEPLADVQVELRDKSTSRLYHLKTGKDGFFKFAGLPHGVYTVTFRREGYAPKDDEWDLDAPQSRMKRVDMPDVVLASEAQVQKTQRMEEAGARNKQAAEKVRSRDFDGAVALLKPALDRNPDDADTLFLLGLAYSGKGLCGEAVSALTRVTELMPTFPGAYLQLGACQRKLGDSTKALAAYDKHLELEPGHADSAYNSGLILFENDRIEEALARFQAGLAARPEDPDLHEMAGRCHINQGRFKDAVEHLRRARAAATDPEKQALIEELIREAERRN
jgi:tetratricopeptide (TPR) repeat protein